MSPDEDLPGVRKDIREEIAIELTDTREATAQIPVKKPVLTENLINLEIIVSDLCRR